MNKDRLKIAFFDTHQFERDTFEFINQRYGFNIQFIESRLNADTSKLAEGCEVVCCFVNDKISAECIRNLFELGIKMIALRSAGFNNVDLLAAEKNKIIVTRVPSYSPYAVAEFATGLLLSLNRKIHRAFLRVREQNFSLDGLVGFDLHGKTVGIIGAGKIGQIFSVIMASFGCRVLVHDLKKDSSLLKNSAITYVDCTTLCKESEVISLHIPLTPQTYHIIDESMISHMKTGVLIINTGRGALIDARALIEGLKSGKIGGAALDVYEEEEGVFFQNLSEKILQDDVLARLLTFPNVLLTSHQAFLTKEALQNIAITTLESISEFQNSGTISNDKVVKSELVLDMDYGSQVVRKKNDI